MSDTLGPTGEFPQGKLNAEDEGELALAVSNEGGKVFVHFGVPVEWIGMDPQGAADIAAAILSHARDAGAEIGVPVTFNMMGKWVQA
jgi:hypothetical protein